MRYKFSSNDLAKLESLKPGTYRTVLRSINWVVLEGGGSQVEFELELDATDDPDVLGVVTLKKRTLREDALPSGTVEYPDPLLLGSSMNPTLPEPDCFDHRPYGKKMWYCPFHNEFHEIH